MKIEIRAYGLAAALAVAIGVLLSAGEAAAQVRVSGEAYVGQPFGVAKIVVEIPDALLPNALRGEGLGVSERSARAFYPTLDVPVFPAVVKEVLDKTPIFTHGPLRQDIRGLVRGLLDQPSKRTIYFLFTGAKPLDLTLEAKSGHSLVLPVADNPQGYVRLLQAWWQQYTATASLFRPKPDYPPIIEDFLKATLARRLNLKLAEKDQTRSPRELLADEVAMLSGAESVLAAMQQNRLLGLHNLNQPADRLLPKLPQLDEPLKLAVPADAKVEDIARYVPSECFYVRFGSFPNFLWFQDTLATWNGDMQNLVGQRGIDYSLSQRIEEQLVAKQTAISRLVGQHVIGDVALVGCDFFFREGASFGLLFEAKNNLMLSSDFIRQRNERIARGGASETKVKIAGREISYLSSPDGLVRSYYVTEGNYHLLTTSRRMVERFLEAAAGQGALGPSDEFRNARAVMPLARGDTVFVYISDAFFRNIVSPAYRIETVRRLQAQCDIQSVQLAVLAAASEGKPAGTIAEIVQSGMLPADFGPRPDGSFVRLENREAVDSVRGRRGAFVPAADMPAAQASVSELLDYQRFFDAYQEQWGRMDPMLIALSREPLPQERERIVIDARVMPFAKKHYDLISSVLGPAADHRMAPISGDFAQLEVILKNQRVFCGLRDVVLPVQLGDARSLQLGRLRDMLVGYVGATGDAGLLGFLERPIVLPVEVRGAAMGPLGIARQQVGEFTVYSLQPEVLAAVVPQLRMQPAERPGQIWLTVNDASQVHATPFLNNLGYTRTLETSLNNLRLLHAVEQQLHVPPQKAREAAEYLLAAKLICPLGGKYELRESAGALPEWTSTAIERIGPLPALGLVAPPGYAAPPLNWFRGLKLEAAMHPTFVELKAEVVMQLPKK